MTSLKLRWILTLIVWFSLAGCASSNHGSSLVVVTPSPQPREIISPPPGYSSCSTVAASWDGAVWHPEHKVCQYTSAKPANARGNYYIEAHWACTQYSAQSRSRAQCIKWDWTPAQWVNLSN